MTNLNDKMTCVAGKNSNLTYVGLGSRCDAQRNIFCNNNLECDRSICRKQPSLGEDCYMRTCGNGLICDADICVVSFSKEAGESCANLEACKSGICSFGKCKGIERVKCDSNTDCIGESSCFKETNNNEGFCMTSYQKTKSELSNCHYKNCSSIEIPPGSCNACEKIGIKFICSAVCPRRSDARHLWVGMYALNYLYDCTTLEGFEQKPNSCQIKSMYSNCPPKPHTF